MQKPKHVLEVFIRPGEYYFGDQDTRMRTILGSCVSITFWHPQRLIGGMTHIMLPGRPSGKHQDSEASSNAKYADEVMPLLLEEMKQVDTKPMQYQVKLFGGGEMFPNHGRKESINIGLKNIEAVRAQLDHYGFNSHTEHVGGSGHRYIIFDVWSGHVWVRHHHLAETENTSPLKQKSLLLTNNKSTSKRQIGDPK